MKKIGSLLTKFILALLGVFAIFIVTMFIALSIADSPVYAARVLRYFESDTQDYKIFPERAIEQSDDVSPLDVDYKELPGSVTFSYAGEQHTENLESLLDRTETAAFILIQDDKIIYEAYPNGSRDSINTSFSVAKSFDSALIGAAIAEGKIGSLDDPVIRYIPEIAGRGFDDLTIRNLLQMDSGIRYANGDEIPFYRYPFGDDSLTYYPPDLRKIALSVEASETPIGAAFRYNNYHPLLEGLIIERATGMHVAEYLEEKIWKPMGAEYPASWSLDSQTSGFEKMESGINARAVDFARFGLLFLHTGAWNGRQILPEDWVLESTSPPDADPRVWETVPSWKELGGYYKYHWWGLVNHDGTYEFMARGNLGQLIFIAPSKNVVAVRFGPEPDGRLIWTWVIQALIDQIP